MHKFLPALLCFFMIIMAQPSKAREQSFELWLQELRAEARAKGFSQELINQTLTNIHHKDRIIELDRKQPEGKLTFAEYKKKIISQARIDQGRAMYRQHKELLDKVSAQYGVQPQYIVALWGIETSYGKITGGFNVIEALATLAYDGRRSEFFRAELFNALQILQAGHIDPANMKGSWAGAMGQNQFMPSSFHNFAVDGNNDGRRDIWTSLPDVFASTANYLSASGWKGDERWGRKIKLPEGFREEFLGRDKKRSLLDWKSLGVKNIDGSELPHVPGMRAGVIAPDGLGGDAYLVYSNYDVIMKWNRSTYFATSVGLLADLIAKGE